MFYEIINVLVADLRNLCQDKVESKRESVHRPFLGHVGSHFNVEVVEG